MAEELAGGCTCGKVRYRLRGEPIAFYACHCLDCQRESGSAFGLSMIVRRESLEILEGETKHFVVTRPDGRVTQTARCPHCATRLWSEPRSAPEVRTLRPGTLDDPRAYAPWGNMWTVRAHPWVALAPGPRFERQPEDRLAMVRAWQTRPRG